ncbi:thiamine pyrophosphate-dependent enzyme [Klebsiella sp. BIGb0407]|uniref:thiamine pyrophosphate-dependent enzyme n=1 Tax=Klebsiella sp. BIGb0407 TaxID=2940603 RepID=UPI0021696084|nr:thiamine pyrophosphate-dependent enzyme [Klebsiella sp. BIGb0407]MCS3429942.1 acetolactate synthase-1/2/3 large subunit [Klebsiella sp. BIGb0407]
MKNDSATDSKRVTGYQVLHSTLLEWGITCYAGVTGGGVIHFLKSLDPMVEPGAETPSFYSIAEYSAGFIPLGYFLSGGKVAAAVATSGAATKLLSCGLSDAKLHDIPALYIIPLSPEEGRGQASLQDTSEYGSHIIGQLRSELPDSVFVLDTLETLTETLQSAREQLARSRPVVLILLHSALNQTLSGISTRISPPITISAPDLVIDDFYAAFRRDINGRRLVLLVGEEMARYPDARILTTQLSQRLRCAVIWTINGANAVERSNPYGMGYISFGGNDEATSLYQSLGADDVLLVLGACPDEYTVNMSPFMAGKTYFLSHHSEGYGQIDNSFAHRAQGLYQHISGPLDQLLHGLIQAAEEQPFNNLSAALAPETLNHRQYMVPREGCVDMAEVYLRLDRFWPPNSIGFDDVCLSYKDRQYVTQRPNNNIQFYSLYRGSAMGGAFGAAVGASLSSPDKSVFLFTGDGCFRLFSGSLGEACELGIVIFLINNASFSIVGQGLPIILPEIAEKHYHANLKVLDYCAIARASGWEAESLEPDMSNFDLLLEKIGHRGQKSWLIDIPVDALQVLGHNPRVRNL